MPLSVNVRPWRAAPVAAALMGLAVITSGAPPPVWNDAEIIRHMERAATGLHQAGRLIPPERLNAGLTNTTCAVTLPRRLPTRPMAVERVYEQAQSSVAIHGQFYKCGRCPNWHINPSTCFPITADGVFVANHHAFVKKQEEVGGWIVALPEGGVYPVVEILAASEADDLAIFRADLGEIRVKPLTLAAAREAVGAPVHVLSHPARMFNLFTSGRVARYFVERRAAADRSSGTDPGGTGPAERMAITADFARGSSGGPVLNSAGAVAGVVAATRSIYYSEEDGQQRNLQMVLNICVPADRIRALLAE
jgi:serine protease Do